MGILEHQWNYKLFSSPVRLKLLDQGTAALWTSQPGNAYRNSVS